MTAQIITFTPRETVYAPPRHDERARLQDAWAGVARDIDNDLFWIAQYSRALKAEDIRAAYKEFAAKALAIHLSAYAAGLRALSEYEARL